MNEGENSEKCHMTPWGQQRVNAPCPPSASVPKVTYKFRFTSTVKILNCRAGGHTNCISLERAIFTAPREASIMTGFHGNGSQHVTAASVAAAPAARRLQTDHDAHAEHRFPAPSSKLCQNLLRHWRCTLYLRAATEAVSALRKASVLIRLWKQHSAQTLM